MVEKLKVISTNQEFLIDSQSKMDEERSLVIFTMDEFVQLAIPREDFIYAKKIQLEDPEEKRD